MKTVKKTVTILICVCVCFFFCNDSYCQDKLPDTWQPGMILKMNYSGGMCPCSNITEIKEKNSYRLTNTGVKIIRKDLYFTKNELDSLLWFLKAKAFDKLPLRMDNGTTLDKGTSIAILQWDGGAIGLNIDELSDIPKKDRPRFEAIREYIYQLLRRKQAFDE